MSPRIRWWLLSVALLLSACLWIWMAQSVSDVDVASSLPAVPEQRATHPREPHASPVEAPSELVVESLSAASPESASARISIDSIANLVISGRVIDQAGAPLEHADVVVAESGVDKPHLILATTAADGSFTVFEDWKSEEVIVRVTHKECWNAQRRTVSHGTRNLELSLERYAALEGRLSLGDGVPVDHVWLRLVQEDFQETARRIKSREGADGERTDPEEMDRDGRFLAQRIRPGTYRLVVSEDGYGPEIARVAGIELKAGQLSRDARCNPFLVRVERSVPIQVPIEVGGDPLPEPPQVLRVALVFVVEGEREPEMNPDSQWAIELGDMKPEDARAMGRMSGLPYFDGADLDSAGRARVQVPRAGRYRVRWFTTTGVPGSGQCLVREVPQAKPEYVTIDAFASQPVLQLRFAPAGTSIGTGK